MLKINDCDAFIKRALKAGTHLTLIQTFLQKINIHGLSRAIELFDLSHFFYRQEFFPLFEALTHVLANPLCQTIFDARLRCFSDYSTPSDPINSSRADTIILQLSSLNDEETSIQTFFDFFAEFRPFPESQKYITEVKISDHVTMALHVYFSSRIETIKTKQDYLHLKELIKKTCSQGGDETLFAQIKYTVASAIETEDLYSTRNFSQLMNEIKVVLSKPQYELNPFIEQIETSKSYRELIGETNSYFPFLNPLSATSLQSNDDPKKITVSPK